LARYVLSLTTSPAMTASEQWFERTLDDSANKRISIPESFLAIDGILVILADVMDGLVVHPKVIHQAIAAELPFIATENILMAAVRSGGDRQKLHDTIRKHSVAAAKQVKELGKKNDLIPRLKADPLFTKIDFANLLKPKDYIGLAPQQVEAFLQDVIKPYKQKFKKYAHIKTETLRV
ncbi:MAG: adenylosuccinate lyase, partial [Planctomycetes bacterium]|nr:adenylosuccinate lyase [Planctomycetota bacterium]